MPDKKPDQEDPSIEEILASIRQIISDDDGAAAPVPPASSSPPAPEPPPPPANDDIIDLTEKADPPANSFPAFLEQAAADPFEEVGDAARPLLT